MSREPNNRDRAEWARLAVNAYAEETRHGLQEQTVSGETEEDRDHAEEVIGDLFCDLHHLCDVLGVSFDEVLRRGQSDWGQDVSEERQRNDRAALSELLTPDPWGQAANEWRVQKPARELTAGDRIIFSDEMGGEGEVVTVESATNLLGSIAIHTEELDFGIVAQPHQWINIAVEEGK
jgi:hypothetical protein